jgi:catechol 2,3-dioxygenase-like lactoylglutathione lyase family enzyme
MSSANLRKPALSGISQVSMRALDLERSVAFYTDILGLDLLSKHDGMAFILAGSVRIMLAVPESAELNHPGSVLYFGTEDIDADCAALEALGVEIIRGPFVVHEEDRHEFWLAFFRDSEGNTLGLSQWRHAIA